ncbi:hypothetical protein JW879_09505 [candidate division WOR-3 bacterium]|nr:hypothetical protein [candidate division WOR-3 bacterium]
MRHRFIIFLTLIILLALACGAKSEADNSTREDWKTNVALWHEYRSKLIFAATETTSRTGEKEMSLIANNRDVLISIFKRLKLDGVPSMNEKRGTILRMIDKAPGGNRVAMSEKLATDISSFWDEVLKYAEKYGVSSGG